MRKKVSKVFKVTLYTVVEIVSPLFIDFIR